MMKVHTIIPGLYTRGEFRKVQRGKKVTALNMLGVKVVVACYGDYDTDFKHPEVDGMIRYWHIPFADGKLIPTQLLARPVEDAAAALRRKEGVLVHCHAGRNRAGLVAALIVREMYGVTGVEALRLVRDARPNAVANPAFEAYLEGLKMP
jgi:protein-tyrosine phosphatase